MTESGSLLRAGMLHQPNLTTLPPQEAIEISATVLHHIAGRRSPDIILVASNLWCVRHHTDLRVHSSSLHDRVPAQWNHNTRS